MYYAAKLLKDYSNNLLPTFQNINGYVTVSKLDHFKKSAFRIRNRPILGFVSKINCFKNNEIVL